MHFIFPSFLFALFALAIPVVIHLFSFRRYKTVYFSNVKFLKEVKEETSSRNKLKHLLVLAARMLALSFLVFAFAQPYIPDKNNQQNGGRKYVSVFIDNSFSMNAVSDGKSLFDKAKQTAIEIAGNYSAADQFQLLTNDFEARHQRLLSKDEFVSQVKELEISAAVRNLSEVVKRQKDLISTDNGGSQIAYLLSDFQKNVADFIPDSSVKYNLVPLSADAQANVYIDTVWFNEPVQLLGQSVKLIVKISNNGEKAVENNRLVLKLNGQTKNMFDFTVEAGSYVYDTLSFAIDKPGWNKAELQIQDYPITYDDNYFVAFDAIEKIKVVVINNQRSNLFLDALYKDEPTFEYLNVDANSFDASLLKNTQLVILNDISAISSSLSAAMGAYVMQGGAVVLFPDGKANLESLNRFLNTMQANSIAAFSEQPQDMAGINLQQNIFKDVFERIPENMNLPRANKYFQFTHSTTSNEEAILTLKDGSSFLSRYPYGAGSLYVCAVPLNKDFSELPVHAVFVPMLYKMAALSIRQGNIAYFMGDKTRIEIDKTATGKEEVYKIKGENVEFIPEQFSVGNKILLGLSNQVSKAGFYTVGTEKGDSAELIALNFDRKESDMQFLNAAALKEKYNGPNISVVDGSHAEVATVVKELDRGISLWKYCIMLALLFLAVEIALLRFWRV